MFRKPVQKIVRAGSVVQLNPTTCRNQMFAGCMLTVTEVKSFGVQGYVQALGENGNPGGQAYLRPTWGEIEFVGTAPFVID